MRRQEKISIKWNIKWNNGRISLSLHFWQWDVMRWWDHCIDGDSLTIDFYSTELLSISTILRDSEWSFLYWFCSMNAYNTRPIFKMSHEFEYLSLICSEYNSFILKFLDLLKKLNNYIYILIDKVNWRLRLISQ